MHVEILPPKGKVKYLDKQSHSWTRKPQRYSTESGAHGPPSPGIDRNHDTDYTCSTQMKLSALRRLIIETKKKIQIIGRKDIRDDEKSEDTQEEDSTQDEYDQDSSISFDDDADSTSSQEDDLEDWIGYIK